MDLKIESGNMLLSEKLADAVGRENILLSHKIVSITPDSSNGVMIVCGNGQRH